MTAGPLLIVASAAIILLLGILHLVFTFLGRRLWPRDSALVEQMQSVSPVITSETTMWRAWIGFNASHSYGAILFGSIYGYLALAESAVLMSSAFLLGLGLATLLAYAFLGQRYWFSVPRRGIFLATALYLTALLL